jgi:hypothetical protein
VVEQAAVAGAEAGLCQLARRLDRLGEVGEVHRRTRAEDGPGLEAHPRLGDHAERSFGAAEEAVR